MPESRIECRIKHCGNQQDRAGNCLVEPHYVHEKEQVEEIKGRSLPEQFPRCEIALTGPGLR